MFLEEILELAIGLIFMWLVMSIAAMQIQEWIANQLKWRSQELEKAITNLLGDRKLASEFYNHPIIAGLRKSPASHAAANTKSRSKPSYIAAQQFAQTMFDIFVTAGTEVSLVRKTVDVLKSATANMFGAIQTIEQRALAESDWETILATARQLAVSQQGEQALVSLKSNIQAFGDKYPELKPAIEQSLPGVDEFYRQQKELAELEAGNGLALQQVRLGLMALHAARPEATDTMKRSVDALLYGVEEYALQGEKAIALARHNLEGWYDSAMDRLVGWYKRKAQLVAFLIGLTLALILNVDSLTIAQAMWREPTLREAIVANAESYVAENPDGAQTGEDGEVAPAHLVIQDLQTSLSGLNLPIGWTGTPTPMDQVADCRPGDVTREGENGLQELFGVRINDTCYPLVNTPPFKGEYIYSWLSKLLGLLITGAAAAQGAPFWFDILKKIVNVRSAGVNPRDKEGRR